jgi:hypothetical protein
VQELPLEGTDMRRILTRILVFAFASVVLVVLLRSTPEPWVANDLSNLTRQLNEAAAIGVPHDFLMDKKIRSTNDPLFAKVEAGIELNEEESRQYRVLFQSILHDSQGFLGAFDRELSVVSDHAMERPNNIAGSGIGGLHDHHDISARKNFSKLLASLESLDMAGSAMSRIFHANAAQKDLVDLISHLGVAPHTVSIGYEKPDAPWPDGQLGMLFEEMVLHYKQAQSERVNSLAYWTAVDEATAKYAALILAVQDRIWSKTSAWERRVAGRFNAVQTFAPPVDLARPLRKK